MTKLNGLLTELTRKRAYHHDQITKIDAALSSLKGIDGIHEEPIQVWTKEMGTSSITYKHGKLKPQFFATDYIRRKGNEVTMKELFSEYYKTIGQALPANSKERIKKYQQFSGHFATARIKGKFVRKLYRLEGVGRELYINVDSAIKLQTSKVEQNPDMIIKEIV